MKSTESLLGFQLRLSPARIPQWSNQSRNLFLLREDIRWPLSVDPRVWPKLEDRVLIARLFKDSFHGDPPNGLALYVDLLVEQLQKPYDGSVVAITATPSAASELKESHVIDESPFSLSRLSGEGFEPLGYDVADRWFLSGLMNCALHAVEREELSAKYAGMLNSSGLFASAKKADEFRSECDKRIPEHSPFYVYGIWSRTSVTPGKAKVDF